MLPADFKSYQNRTELNTKITLTSDFAHISLLIWQHGLLEPHSRDLRGTSRVCSSLAQTPLYICTREVLGSNLCWDAGYIDRKYFVVLFSPSRESSGINTTIKESFLPNNFQFTRKSQKRDHKWKQNSCNGYNMFSICITR
jgi:hypothetical protein